MSKNLAEKLLPRTWRKVATHTRYEEERETDLKSGTCPLCETTPVRTFNYWKILANEYPYDAVAERHDLIQPIRHVDKFEHLTAEEIDELKQLKETYLNQNYTFFFEAMNKNKSIPGHLHYHLIVPKIID